MTGSAFERLEASVQHDPNGGCWLWAASVNRAGYGVTWHNGRTGLAHRVAWTVYKGEIPFGLMVCHKCDVPACVNPDHLFLGTSLDNNRDKVRKGRCATGSRNGSAKLTAEKVADIRRNATGPSWAEKKYGVCETNYYKIMNSDRDWETNDLD